MLITEVELKDATGIKTKASLQKWCDRNTLPYLITENGLITTLVAVDNVLNRRKSEWDERLDLLPHK